jgi:Ca-activated chloride channel family protein
VSFTHPERLALAALISIAFALAYAIGQRRTHVRSLAYSNLSFALEALRPSRLPAVALGTAFVLGVAALGCASAGPRFVVRVPIRDGTIVLCIDTSGSMAATDVAPSRLQAAKAAARAFIDDVPPGTRVGVVTFATDARVVVPPLEDREVVRGALERVAAPNGATALGDALMLAGEGLPTHGRRVVVVLTDGVNNRGVDPLQAARSLGRAGIALDAVGMGTNGSGLLIPGTTEPDDLDESTLRAMAAATGGTYVRVGDAGALRRAFRALAASTVWEWRRVDGGLAVALGGGSLIAFTLLAGLAAGRWP